MIVERFLHVKLDVSNMNRSMEFYLNILGFREVCKYETKEETIVHVSPTGNQPALELWYHKKPFIIQQMAFHVAFQVDDVMKWISFLRRKGIKIIEKPFRKGNEIIAFVEDPDGHSIELLEETKGRCE